MPSRSGAYIEKGQTFADGWPKTVRVLVIGGCGFLGSHIVDRFLRDKWKVTVLDRRPEKFRKPLSAVQYVFDDFSNKVLLEEILSRGVDTVVHAASSVLPSQLNLDPQFDVQSNLLETLALFQSCVKHKVKKVLFPSSGGTIYGRAQYIPIDENHPTNPVCSYGVVKLSIEKYLQLFSQLYGLRFAALRISNPYGPRQDPHSSQGAVAVFLLKILASEKLAIWGDGGVVRDYVYVEDIAELFYCAASSDVSGVFNAGSGSGVGLLDLVHHIGATVGAKPQFEFLPPRDFDVPTNVLNCAKARTQFGWSPQISLQDGLARSAEWQKIHVS